MSNLSQGDFWEVCNKTSLEMFIKHITQMYEEKGFITVKLKAGKTRTTLQNNALHVYCRLMAEQLNDAGYDMKNTLKAEVEIPWTTELVKEYLWKPVQSAITGSDSTSTASREDYDKTHQVLSKHISEKFNIYVEFPKR